MFGLRKMFRGYPEGGEARGGGKPRPEGRGGSQFQRKLQAQEVTMALQEAVLKLLDATDQLSKKNHDLEVRIHDIEAFLKTHPALQQPSDPT